MRRSAASGFVGSAVRSTYATVATVNADAMSQMHGRPTVVHPTPRGRRGPIRQFNTRPSRGHLFDRGLRPRTTANVPTVAGSARWWRPAASRFGVSRRQAGRR